MIEMVNGWDTLVIVMVFRIHTVTIQMPNE